MIMVQYGHSKVPSASRDVVNVKEFLSAHARTNDRISSQE